MTDRRRLAGRVPSGIAILFLALDAAMKLFLLQPVRGTMAQLGRSTNDATILGLGLGPGGVVAMLARIGSPPATHTLFAVCVALFVWGRPYPREPRLRALIAGGEARP